MIMNLLKHSQTIYKIICRTFTRRDRLEVCQRCNTQFSPLCKFIACTKYREVKKILFLNFWKGILTTTSGKIHMFWGGEWGRYSAPKMAHGPGTALTWFAYFIIQETMIIKWQQFNGSFIHPRLQWLRYCHRTYLKRCALRTFPENDMPSFVSHLSVHFEEKKYSSYDSNSQP